MKKFMKAIAFVTVMCMALSTVAFAETGAALDEAVAKQVNVTVEGAADGEQVALYIVAEGGDTDDAPLYIDQKPANASGVAYFEAPIVADATVKKVEVYVGYATYAALNSKALHVDTVALEKAITEVKVEKVGTDVIVKNAGQTAAKDNIGAGVGATFAVTAPEGVSATHMIWAIRYSKTVNGETVEDIKYSPKQDITLYGLGSAIENGTQVELGLAFLNGSDLRGIAALEITGVDAIFLFSNQKDAATSEDLRADGPQNN